MTTSVSYENRAGRIYVVLVLFLLALAGLVLGCPDPLSDVDFVKGDGGYTRRLVIDPGGQSGIEIELEGEQDLRDLHDYRLDLNVTIHRNSPLRTTILKPERIAVWFEDLRMQLRHASGPFHRSRGDEIDCDLKYSCDPSGAFRFDSAGIVQPPLLRIVMNDFVSVSDTAIAIDTVLATTRHGSSFQSSFEYYRNR